MLPQRVVVTGASGFVGKAVVRELLARGHWVHALVRDRSVPKGSDKRLSCFRGEADNPAHLDRAISGMSSVIHLVGIIVEKPGASFQRIHVDVTRAVIEACQRNAVQRIVHMSALGARANAPSVYHRTKFAAEEIVRASSLDWTIFRPSMIHGEEGDFTQKMKAWARGKSAPWFAMPYFGAGLLGRGPRRLLQPVHVDDVARLFADALDKPASIGKTYDVAGTQQLTWPEMYGLLSTQLRGKARRTLAIPAWYAALLARVVPWALIPFNRAQVQMSQEDNVADISAVSRDFFAPEGYESAMKRYIVLDPVEEKKQEEEYEDEEEDS